MSRSLPTGSQAADMERRKRIVETVRRDAEMTHEMIRERWGLSPRCVREIVREARR